MPPDIEKEHAIESYNSLAAIGMEGLKLLALLNGGAVVTVLAYLGNLAGKGCRVPDMSVSVSLFLFGLLLWGAAFFFSYETQLYVFTEAVGRADRNAYRSRLWAARIAAVASLLAFAAGALCGVLTLRSTP